MHEQPRVSALPASVGERPGCCRVSVPGQLTRNGSADMREAVAMVRARTPGTTARQPSRDCLPGRPGSVRSRSVTSYQPVNRKRTKLAMTCQPGHTDDGAVPAQKRDRLIVRRYSSLGRIGPIHLLLLAWAICYAGDLAAFTAASVYAYRAGGAGLVGVLGLARGVPAGLLVPLITSWSDRVRRERLLIASVVPRALLLAAAAAAMTGGGQAVLVVVLVALEGGLASVFRQVQAALLPWLASTPDELASANTAASVLQSAATVAGPALAAGLLAAGTPQSAVVLAACGLIAAGAALLTGVRPRSSPEPVPAAGHLRQLRVDMATGWKAGVWQPGARALFLPAAAQTFVRGVLTVLTVIIALDLFSLGSAGIGWLAAVLGVGGLLGGPLAVALVRGRRVARCFGAGVAGWGLPMILLAFMHARYWPYLMFGVMGVANVFDDAGVYSALQQVIPPRLTGRALGTRRGALLISMGLGSAAAPLLIHACGARGTLIGTGMLLIATAASSIPRLRGIDSTISAPGPDYALLRQVPFFRPLPFAITEHLASELKPATYEPGDTIIREGEPGDYFYLIESGWARAFKDGRHLSEMGPADWFGEIALLRRTPRTATVTASTRLHVKILGHEEFLAAVTGNPDSAESADEVVSARLRVDLADRQRCPKTPPQAGAARERQPGVGTPGTRRRASCLARGPRTFPVAGNRAAFRSDLPRLHDSGRSRSLRRAARRGGIRGRLGRRPPDPDRDRRRGARSYRARVPAQDSLPRRGEMGPGHGPPPRRAPAPCPGPARGQGIRHPGHRAHLLFRCGLRP